MPAGALIHHRRILEQVLKNVSHDFNVNSSFETEFRRYGLAHGKLPSFEDFFNLVMQIHKLTGFACTLWYTDPEGDLLPLSNNENFAKALTTAQPLLRVTVQRKGQRSTYDVINNMHMDPSRRRYRQEQRIAISEPEDFRRVSSIIDVDIIPSSQRRVRLMKNGSDRPLGFYIRDGTSIRVTASGLERIPGIFISRLVPGGLAESTGLLAVNDEVLEVNGIDVTGKTLDQVTDMMVANSANLIVTVKPANQHNNVEMVRGSARSSKKSIVSTASWVSSQNTEHAAVLSADQDADLITDHLSMINIGRPHSGASSMPETV